MDRIRNASTGLLLVLLVVVCAVAVFVTVRVAGGGLEPTNSNTPNATVPGPPSFPK